MTVERHVRLFRNGRSQAVRIPRELELPGSDAVIRKDEDRLIIQARPSLIALLATLDPIEEDLDGIDDPPPESVEL